MKVVEKVEFHVNNYSGIISMKIGMILFDGMTQLDLTGPLEIFSRWPETTIYLISINSDPVVCDRYLKIVPTTTFENCPELLDILFVPGGSGVSAVLDDHRYLAFIQVRGKASRYVTSVCTGSIILAACGLLDGYKATTHWLSVTLLEEFNIDVPKERVVMDRNRITGGGVTSGIDFALQLTAVLLGESIAKEIQLSIEYNPQPPFKSGHPDVADRELVSKIKEARREVQQRRLDQIKAFRKSLP
jgi:cyclohexyl-isocyanide hydratase